MQDFMMLFHSIEKPETQPSPQDFQEEIQRWQDWIGGIAAQGKFIKTDALVNEGKTLHSDGKVTDGPYTELKEIVGGYIMVKADGYDDALSLAKGCPVLTNATGKVEIRPIMDLGD